MSCEYKYHDGYYWFYIGDVWKFATKSVSVGFSICDGVPIFAIHGRTEDVEGWSRRAQAALVGIGEWEAARSIHIISSDHETLERLNSLIKDPDFISEYIKIYQ